MSHFLPTFFYGMVLLYPNLVNSPASATQNSSHPIMENLAKSQRQTQIGSDSEPGNEVVSVVLIVHKEISSILRAMNLLMLLSFHPW
jgi:hypothetical protein